MNFIFDNIYMQDFKIVFIFLFIGFFISIEFFIYFFNKLPFNGNLIASHLTLYYPLTPSLVSVSIRFMGLLLLIIYTFFFFKLSFSIFFSFIFFKFLKIFFFISLIAFFKHSYDSMSHLEEESLFQISTTKHND